MADQDMHRLSAAITRYNEPDWIIAQALLSLHLQRAVSMEVLVLDQSPSATLEGLCRALAREGRVAFDYIGIPSRGLSAARNAAIDRARNPILAFLDADAFALPDWAAGLAAALSDGPAAIAGARILPVWHGQPPLATRSRLVQDQYSVFDLGPDRLTVSRVVGAGFAIHRTRLGGDAYFEESLGRKDGRLLSGEETELCHRARRAGLEVVYAGNAVVHHNILGHRMTGAWLRQRLYYSGMNRARLGGAPGPSHSLGLKDYLALPALLPSYLGGFWTAWWRLRGRRRADADRGR